jgi:hypothetical protein
LLITRFNKDKVGTFLDKAFLVLLQLSKLAKFASFDNWIKTKKALSKKVPTLSLLKRVISNA